MAAAEEEKNETNGLEDDPRKANAKKAGLAALEKAMVKGGAARSSATATPASEPVQAPGLVTSSEVSAAENTMMASEAMEVEDPMPPGLVAPESVSINGFAPSAPDKIVKEIEPVDQTCWDLKRKGFCPRLKAGQRCTWHHPMELMVQFMGSSTAVASVVQHIDARSELHEIEGKTIDAPHPVDPPAHLVDAIAGSMRMKRHLEADMAEGQQEFERLDLIEEMRRIGDKEANGLAEPLPKRRRLITLNPDSLCSWEEDENEDAYMPYNEEEEEKIEKVQRLLKKWRMVDNYGAKFSLETLAYTSEVEKLLEEPGERGRPDPNNQQHSIAEQTVMKLVDMRTVQGPPTYDVDAIKTFAFKWGLDDEEAIQTLHKLGWNALRYVLTYYDGSDGMNGIEEFAKQGELEGKDAKDKHGRLLYDLPGPQSTVRTQRLELIDPHADCLVLGDANLTFANILAEHRAGLGHKGKVIATTFESFATLKLRYKELARTVKSLLELGSQVWHGVDCTRLAEDTRFHGTEESFGAVYYNFPHAGAVRGFFDQHPFVNWRHSNLMSLFFRAIRYFVKPGAIVKVASNARAKGVQASQIIMAAEYSDFMHIETFHFTEWILRRYHRSYGDRRDEKVRPDADSYRSQNAGADMVYCFRYMPTGMDLRGVPIKQPPQMTDFLDSVSACACGFICQSELMNKQGIYTQGGGGAQGNKLHFKDSGSHMKLKDKEKRQAVLELYKRFLTEASGVHIG